MTEEIQQGDSPDSQDGAGSKSAAQSLSKEYFENMVSAVPDLMLCMDMAAHDILYSNHPVFRFLGWELDETAMPTKQRIEHWAKMVHPEDSLTARDPKVLADDLSTSSSGTIEGRIRLCNGQGEWRHYLCRTTILPKNEAGAEHMLLLLRDITERIELDENRHQAAKVFENSGEGIMILDSRLKLRQVNVRLQEISGYKASELIGQSPVGLMLPAETDVEEEIAAGAPPIGFYEQALSQGYSHAEGLGLRKGGEAYHALTSCSVLRNDENRLQSVIITQRDVTESKLREERIRHLAYYDALTELPNRTLFYDRLEHEMQRCERNGHCAALLFLDLDQFKAVNDSLGHAAGDTLLQTASERLKDNVRSEDTVARMSGDEFTIILSGQQSRDHVTTAAAHVARKILRELAEPFHLEGNEAFVSVSIGIAVYPEDGVTASDLLRSADTAMYFAKEAGKNNFQFFTGEMNDHSKEQLELQNNLYRAVSDQEFEVFYQLQHHFGSGERRVVESLLRWRTPDNKLIPPADFLPLAEQTGLIIRMGDWLIERTLWQFAEWRSMGLPIDLMAINLSARQFADEKVINKFSELLSRYRIPGECVAIELTETSLMADISITRRVLDQFKGLGVGVVIDDFGTGYSSMSDLKELPIDALKIDGRFISCLPGKPEDQQLVRAMAAVAEGFDLPVIAEGVETEAQAQFVAELGCSAAQGFLYCEPQPAYDLEKILKSDSQATQAVDSSPSAKKSA